jgi:integral membrane protein (TIGR01906 family)
MNAFARIATVLFVVAVPVFLITSNVRWVAGDSWFYKDGFRTHEVDQTTGIEFAQLDAAADDLVRYFEDDRSNLNIQVMVDGREAPLFSEEEISHMRDVKGLIRFVFRLHEISLGILIAYIGAVVLWTRERTPRQLAKYALLGVATGMAVVAGIGVFALTGFDQAWTTFHEIAFRNDLWQLDPDTDRLIQMFPEPFWQDMTYLVGALTVFEVLATVSVAAGYLVWGRDRMPPLQSRRD